MYRTFHIIDIENLAGTAAHRDLSLIAGVRDAYWDGINIGPLDQFLVGTNMRPLYRLTVGLAWPGARIVSGRGPDGADRALLQAVDATWLISRGFDRVVIGSGDHAFADLAAQLKSAGITVEIFAPAGKIHHSLWPASVRVRVLPEPRCISVVEAA